MGLKVAQLREISRERGVTSSGRSEDLATRIAESYKWDEKEIARLILNHDEYASADRGHSSRLFPLGEGADLLPLNAAIQRLAGRYVRVGIAQWFIFDAPLLNPNRANMLEVRGTYRSYQASVDDVWDQPHLSAIPVREQRIRVLISQGSELLDVRAGTTQSARAAVQAFVLASKVAVLPYVPNAEGRVDRPVGRISSTTEFMLDLLENRLRGVGLSAFDLTVARFRVADSDPGSGEGRARPVLRAVRFEGRYLLDSVPACRLIARDRRPLVDIGLGLTYHISKSESGQYPVKVAIESDHVLVATGYGTVVEASIAAHNLIVSAVSDEIRAGVQDEKRLSQLVDRILVRANESETPDEATMLLEGRPDEAALVVGEELEIEDA